jgi:hypothetical protein
MAKFNECNRANISQRSSLPYGNGTNRAVTWADDVMHAEYMYEAKGWQALGFREANAIPEVIMQHYARCPQ